MFAKSRYFSVLACTFLTAAFALFGTARSNAAPVGMDPTGSTDVYTYIVGILGTPSATLDFQLLLNAVYTADPDSRVSGNILLQIYDSASNIIDIQFAGGDVFDGDAGNTGNLANETHFLVNILATDLPILVQVTATLDGFFLAGFGPTLTVDLPEGLQAVQTPIPGSMALFATGAGIIGWAGMRRRRRAGADQLTARPAA